MKLHLTLPDKPSRILTELAREEGIAPHALANRLLIEKIHALRNKRKQLAAAGNR